MTVISDRILTDTRPGYVYRIFDRCDRLLYIGCSVDVTARLANHRMLAQPWWPYMVRHTVAQYPSALAARDAEYAAIQAEIPVFNYTEIRDGWMARRAEFYAVAHMERPAHVTRKPITDEVRERIRARHAAGVSQKTLATEFGVSRSTVSIIVRNQRRVRVPGGYAMVAA